MSIFLDKKNIDWLHLILAVILLSSWTALAQEATDDDDDDEAEEGTAAENAQQLDPNVWKKEREEIFKEIQKEADKRARTTVTKEGIAELINEKATVFEDKFRKQETRVRKRFITSEENKWREMEDGSMPSAYPDMSQYTNITIPEWKVNNPIQEDKKNIANLMRKELERLFESKIPPKTYEQLQTAGKEKFPMYTLEDGKDKPVIPEGLVQLRGGRGYGTKISGRLEFISVNRLKIGARTIRREDLDEKMQSLFYNEVNEKIVEAYILQEQRRYTAIKESFVEEWIRMTLPDKLMSQNYVPNEYLKNPKARLSTATDNWIPRNNFLNRLYSYKLKKEIERITPEITDEFFTNAAEKFGYSENYEFVKEANDGKGEWMPTTAAEQWRMAQQAKQNPQQPNGENPDMPPPAP